MKQNYNNDSKNPRKIRYAVVGLGWIAQEEILPAFRNLENSELTALVSGDAEKLDILSERYGIQHCYSYEEYDNCLNSGAIDAVFIALPNHLHCEYALKAAKAGIHILCEKPMAVTEEECEQMIRTAEENKVKLMVAYRLHFDKANMEAVRIVQSGEIGDPRIFNSVFTQQVAEDNVRLMKVEKGGGTVYDLGIYCLNAARYLFQDEPIEVFAMSASNDETRFEKMDEMTSAILRFPQDRLATFTASFGGAKVSIYQVVGTKGDLRMDASYAHQGELHQQITINGETREQSFPAGDQFAAEIFYFSNCVIQDKKPEPSGEEGVADIRVIQAIYESARSGQPVKLGEFDRQQRPTAEQIIQYPAKDEKPDLVNATDLSGKS